MSDLQVALIDTLQTRGYEALVSEIKKALPPLVVQMLAERLSEKQPRPGDPRAPTTTR
jgi:hypothetical protein